MEAAAFRSKRIVRTRTIRLNDAPDQVFPLFGPIREKDWAAGWDPHVIYSDSANAEEHMVFTTQSHHGAGDIFIWTITRYQPQDALVEYTVFAPERLWRVVIQCRPGDRSRATRAEITYTFTGLTARGNEVNELALSHLFRHDLEDWEQQINRYLESKGRVRRYPAHTQL